MPVNESNTIQYTVTTTNTADGTTLYWKTTGNTTNADIVGGNTGSITITNNRAVFNVTILADETTEGSKTLGIAIATGSQSGPTVVTTPAPIVVNDTSISPAGYLANILVVGGGGASRTGYSAGGGGGGFIESANTLVVGTLYTVTVGAGGAINSSTATGSNVGSLLVTGAGSLGGTTTGGSSGSPQNNSGGTSPGSAAEGPGGGGGAGGNGGNGFNGTGGNGGVGLYSSITGTQVGYCGGGGGSGGGNGGTASFGGGRGGVGTFGDIGQPNTGGGAGGSYTPLIGRPGGSGIVVFSWPTGGLSSDGIPINPTLSGTYTQTTSGGNTIVTFTGSGTFTA